MMGSRAQMRICLIIILLCTSMVAADVPLQFAVPAMQSGLAKLEQWTPMVEYLKGSLGAHRGTAEQIL